jgi:hypothetical protein
MLRTTAAERKETSLRTEGREKEMESYQRVTQTTISIAVRVN